MLALLKIAQTKNAQIGVTGILLFHENTFFQVLEGPEFAVRQIYEKVAKDPRHNKVLKIIQEPIEMRNFSAWTMGFANMRVVDLKSIPGLNDFFSRGSYFNDLESGTARELLAALKDGRWRQFIGFAA